MDNKREKYNLRPRHYSGEKEKNNKKLRTKNVTNEVRINGGINTLNDDCLRQVFQYLSEFDRIKIERVCRRWQAVGESSWNEFTKMKTVFYFNTADAFNKYGSKAFFSILSRGGLFLKEVTITLHDLNSLDDLKNILNCFSKFCNNIEKLHLGRLGSDSFRRDNFNAEVVDQFLKPLFLKNKNLKFLSLESSNITGKCLLSLPFNSIETIHIRYRIFIKENYLKKAFSKLKNLKSCTLVIFTPKLLNIILKEITFDKNKLTSLKLSEFNRNISESDFSTYFAAMKNLKIINFHELNVNDKEIMSLPTDSIEEIFFYYYHETHFKLNCILNFINLKHLVIGEYPLVNDEFCKNLTIRCSNLKIIQFDQCRKLSDEGILKISTLPKLEQLFLNTSKKITELILPNLTHLKGFGIPNISKITGDGIVNYIKSANNLKDFRIQNSGVKYQDFKNAIMSNKNILKIQIQFNCCIFEIDKNKNV